jgi:hypothetical protein
MNIKTFEPGAYAAAANELIASITPVLQSMSFPDGGRVHLSLNLAKSSIDLGHAATALIATDHSYNGMAALVLMRPQLEHLFRGIYIGTHADVSDDFIAKFMEGKSWAGPNFQALSQHAAAVLSKAPMGESISAWEKLPNMVNFAKNSLHEFVHGGKSVLDAYNHETGIAFSPEHFDNGQAITNITATALFGLSFAQSISIISGGSPDEAFNAFLAKYCAWISMADALGLGPGE